MTTPLSPSQSAAKSPLHLPDLLLGAATVPLLLGLVASRVGAHVAQELGSLSEEVFRGDRLPILSTSAHPDTPQETSAPD